MRPVTPELIAARAAYVQRWGSHLDDHFGSRLEVAGKRIFVLGAGWGAEALWALKRGATEVVGVDPQDADRRPFDRALAEEGLSDLGSRYTMLSGTTVSVSDIGTFDLAMSNNVLEHVFGLSANLASLGKLLPSKGGRFAVFVDPLYFSSLGHHLPIGPWEHLTLAQADIRARIGPYQWEEYRTGLNGMTITDFLSAVREAGMILLDLSVRSDLHLEKLPDFLSTLPSGLKPMDLALSGFACTLAFPHNL